MSTDSSPLDTVSWTLSGPWLWIYRATMILMPIVVVVAVVVFAVKLAGPTPPPWWLPALFVAVVAFLVWVQVRTATAVSLTADGDLDFHRPLLGTVRVPAASVRSIGRPVLGGYRSGVRVRSATTTVPLAVGMPSVPTLVEHVARYNGALKVGQL